MKVRLCKHCNCEFDISDKPKGWMANHTRWCEKNPNLYLYKNNAKKTDQLFTKKAREKAIIGIKKAWSDGKYKNKKQTPGHKHTEETKRKLSNIAKKSKHRRLCRSVRKYFKKDGTFVMLDSSWEELLAKRLDDLNISWIRPEPIKWKEDRNYFPDFYLVDYDIFLDPKNPYACKAQEEKIKWLTEHVPNLIILKSIEEINNFHP